MVYICSKSRSYINESTCAGSTCAGSTCTECYFRIVAKNGSERNYSKNMSHLPKAGSCPWASNTLLSHHSFTRLLLRQPPDTEALWEEVKDIITPETGFLIIDDTVLDKPYSKHIDLVYRQWGGKHHQTVNGINLETVVWTYNDAVIPVDFRIYDIDTTEKQKMITSSIC